MLDTYTYAYPTYPTRTHARSRAVLPSARRTTQAREPTRRIACRPSLRTATHLLRCPSWPTDRTGAWVRRSLARGRVDVGSMSSPASLPSRPYIIAVSGSRGITAQATVWGALDLEWTEVACAGQEQIEFRLGDAARVDHLALRWARERGFARAVYFADQQGYDAWCQSRMLHGEGEETAFAVSDWDHDGKLAGHARNSAMIGVLEPQYKPLANLLVCVWDGTSPGSRNAMASARNARVPIRQYGGVGPIQFKVAGPRDAELVVWRSDLGVPE